MNEWVSFGVGLGGGEAPMMLIFLCFQGLCVLAGEGGVKPLHSRNAYISLLACVCACVPALSSGDGGGGGGGEGPQWPLMCVLFGQLAHKRMFLR